MRVAKPRRAMVVGTGLIGASAGMALRRAGWHVSGTDSDAARQAEAAERGALDEVGVDPDADLAIVAVPVGAIAHVAREALAALGPSAAVTDVGGVKASVVEAVRSPRFVGGHPMAGSELEGPQGADPSLFEGATWVLTPVGDTDPEAFRLVSSVVGDLGAEVVALSPERHDALVAIVSHVPHLVAATMMAEAAAEAEEHAVLLRLAAGGFRDMTRVASGHPGIWPEVCKQNAIPIKEGLGRLRSALDRVISTIDAGDSVGLTDLLESARKARRSLPKGAASAGPLSELRIRIPDRPGLLAELTTTAGELGINLFDLEIAHSAEGDLGVAILVVGSAQAAPLREALVANGMRVATRELG